MHAVADEQLRTYSGHIAEGMVRPPLEVFLTKFSGEVRREYDPATGITRLALDGGKEMTGEFRHAWRNSPVIYGEPPWCQQAPGEAA